LNEYGTPVAVRRDGFALSNYVEWQISYDVVKKEVNKLAKSSLPETEFIGANGKIKALYELSEYIWYFHKWNIISKNDLKNVVDDLNSIKDENLIDNNSELQIDRSHPTEKKINGFSFEYTQVKYPLLIYKFMMVVSAKIDQLVYYLNFFTIFKINMNTYRKNPSVI